MFLGSGSPRTTSSLSLINPSICIVLVSSTALLTSIAILVTNEHVSNIGIRFTKLRDWINVITLIYEKTWKQKLIEKNIDEIEALELREIYNRYLDKRRDIMKNTQFKAENIFGDKISKHYFLPEQTTKPKFFKPKHCGH